MNVPEEDAIADVVFCEFNSGSNSVYVDLCSIETCIGTNTGGSVIGLRSGSDVMVDEAPMVVMSSVMMVSNNSAGRSLREAQVGGFATLGDIFSDGIG
jgi:hypothetical protein